MFEMVLTRLYRHNRSFLVQGNLVVNTLFSDEACLLDAERKKNLSYTERKILTSMLGNSRRDPGGEPRTGFFPIELFLNSLHCWDAFRWRIAVWWQPYLAFLLLNALKGKRIVFLSKSDSSILAGYRMFISVGGVQFLDATFLSRKKGISRILHDLVKDS